MELITNKRSGSVTQFINVGAYVNGTRPKTKKALKDAVQNAPDSVTFDSTEVFSANAGSRFGVAHTVATQDILQVCGPDPYNKRNWYASVKGGKVS